MNMSDRVDLRVNVRIGIFRHNKLVDVRETHNVMTAEGRAWALRALAASAFPDNAAPTPLVTSKLKYIGFGCGGALQTDTRFLRTQQELASVVALEDPVPLAIDSGTLVHTYLKPIQPIAENAIFFPTSTQMLCICNTLESEIAFVGDSDDKTAKTFASSVLVGSEVPVSEAGLYLSTAAATHDNGLGNPVAANGLVCYNIFDPIIVTPNTSLRMEWCLRLL